MPHWQLLLSFQISVPPCQSPAHPIDSLPHVFFFHEYQLFEGYKGYREQKVERSILIFFIAQPCCLLMFFPFHLELACTTRMFLSIMITLSMYTKPNVQPPRTVWSIFANDQTRINLLQTAWNSLLPIVEKYRMGRISFRVKLASNFIGVFLKSVVLNQRDSMSPLIFLLGISAQFAQIRNFLIAKKAQNLKTCSSLRELWSRNIQHFQAERFQR